MNIIEYKKKLHQKNYNYFNCDYKNYDIDIYIYINSPLLYGYLI